MSLCMLVLQYSDAVKKYRGGTDRVSLDRTRSGISMDRSVLALIEPEQLSGR